MFLCFSSFLERAYRVGTISECHYLFLTDQFVYLLALTCGLQKVLDQELCFQLSFFFFFLEVKAKG